MSAPEVLEPIALWPVGSDTPIIGMLAYSTEQPDKARLAYGTTSGPRTYTFNRGILADALLDDAPTALEDGEIQLVQSASPKHLLVRVWEGLDDGAGDDVGEWQEMYAELDRLDVIVTRMYAVVPMGRERELAGTVTR